jgi:hypothetical protein
VEEVEEVEKWISKWERFWFEEVPSEIFALVRIAVGAAGLVSLAGSTPVEMFWSPDGIAPLPGGGLGLRSFILESGFSAVAAWGMFSVLFAALACVTVGLFTGPAVIASFLGTVLQARWNALPLTSGHGVLMAALFCMVWADCGARLSLDERCRRRVQSGTPEGLRTRPSGGDEEPRQPIWPLRLLQIQVATVYLSSGVFKLLGPMWRDGSAVYYTTGQNVFGRLFHVYPFPAGFNWLLTLLTYGTVLWEISFPLLLLNRTSRKVALATGVAMHLGIWTMMEVGPFTFMMLATYVAFVDPSRARSVVQRFTSGRRRPGAAPPTRSEMATGSTPAA